MELLAISHVDNAGSLEKLMPFLWNRLRALTQGSEKMK